MPHLRAEATNAHGRWGEGMGMLGINWTTVFEPNLVDVLVISYTYQAGGDLSENLCPQVGHLSIFLEAVDIVPFSTFHYKIYLVASTSQKINGCYERHNSRWKNWPFHIAWEKWRAKKIPFKIVRKCNLLLVRQQG